MRKFEIYTYLLIFQYGDESLCKRLGFDGLWQGMVVGESGMCELVSLGLYKGYTTNQE